MQKSKLSYLALPVKKQLKEVGKAIRILIMEVENKVDMLCMEECLQHYDLLMWLIENVSNLVLVMLKNKTLSHSA